MIDHFFFFFFGIEVNYVGGFQLGKGTATDPVGIVMEFVSTNLRRALEEDSRLQNRQIQLDIAKQVASGMNFLHSLNPYILVSIKPTSITFLSFFWSWKSKDIFTFPFPDFDLISDLTELFKKKLFIFLLALLGMTDTNSFLL